MHGEEWRGQKKKCQSKIHWKQCDSFELGRQFKYITSKRVYNNSNNNDFDFYRKNCTNIYRIVAMQHMYNAHTHTLVYIQQAHTYVYTRLKCKGYELWYFSDIFQFHCAYICCFVKRMLFCWIALVNANNLLLLFCGLCARSLLSFSVFSLSSYITFGTKWTHKKHKINKLSGLDVCVAMCNWICCFPEINIVSYRFPTILVHKTLFFCARNFFFEQFDFRHWTLSFWSEPNTFSHKSNE